MRKTTVTESDRKNPTILKRSPLLAKNVSTVLHQIVNKVFWGFQAYVSVPSDLWGTDRLADQSFSIKSENESFSRPTKKNDE